MDTFDTRYFRLNKLLLSYAGLWPFQSPFNRNIFLYYTIISMLIICLPQIAYLFKHAESLDDFYDVLPSFSGGIICFTKTVSLHYKSKKFKVIFRHVHDDWCNLANHEDMRILIEYVEKSRIVTLAYLIFISTGAVSYVTAPLTVPILDVVLARNLTRTKRLPHPSEFFLDQEKYYYVLLGITYLAYVACVIVATAADTVYFALLQHACGMLAIVSHRLENFAVRDKSRCIDRDPTSKSDKDARHIVRCVELQISTERLIQLIESMFDICLIIDIGVGILFQCASCVMIVTHMDIMEMMRNGSLLLLQSSRVFFSCWVGQRVIDHSSQIHVAAYNGMWYRTSLKAQRMLLLLIAKCQKPCHVTMAKLYVISLEAYSTVMRMSVSYVTLMISLQSDDM